MMDKREAWLASLKVGDQVVVKRPNFAYVGEIKRLTPTQFIVGEARYRRDNGKETDHFAMNQSELLEATPGLVKAIEQRERKDRLIEKIKKLDLHALSTEALEKIIGIVESERRATEARLAGDE